MVTCLRWRKILNRQRVAIPVSQRFTDQTIRIITSLGKVLQNMKRRFFIPTLALSCALTLTAGAESPQSIKLKQQLPVGKKVHQSIVMNQKMKMGGIPGAPDGGGMNITNKITMGMNMDIKKEGADKKKMVLTYDEMAMAMDAGVFKQEFASDDENSPFAGIVGKGITITYDKDEQIEKVEGTDALFEGAGGGAPGMDQMMEQMFGEEQLKQTMNQMMLQMIPDRELKIGESWDYTMEVPMPQGMGKMKMEGTYTLKKFDKYEGHDCAVLGMTGKLKTDGKTKMNMQGQEIAMEFKDSKFEGDIYFDNKLGLARKSDMLTTMKMAMDMLGQEMTMDMNMTIIQKVTKVE